MKNKNKGFLINATSVKYRFLYHLFSNIISSQSNIILIDVVDS